ncbi:MAG: response regulator [Thermoanaerobaculales bacterium]
MEKQASEDEKQTSSTAGSNPEDGARILVIDDSPTVVHTIRRALEPAGYSVETLALLIELPQRLKTDPPSLIVLDLHMPALSGVRIAGLIRSFQPHEIPVVIYSSRPLTEIQEAAAEIGAVGFVEKGSQDHLLVASVKIGLHKARLDRLEAKRTS